MPTNAATRVSSSTSGDMKLEVVVIPVSDVDRAKQFYAGLGWRLDADFVSGDLFRVIPFTPSGSRCSVIFGEHVTDAAPGSARCLYLIVPDVLAAREELHRRGVEVGDVFHPSEDGDGRDTPHLLGAGRISGPDPQRRSDPSYASFEDPDGNGWFFQEVTTRLPGRVDPSTTTFSSASDLANALRPAAAAHGEHEARVGARDENWPERYAGYLVDEPSGGTLPS